MISAILFVLTMASASEELVKQYTCVKPNFNRRIVKMTISSGTTCNVILDMGQNESSWVFSSEAKMARCNKKFDIVYESLKKLNYKCKLVEQREIVE